jgi:hypothetical protein
MKYRIRSNEMLQSMNIETRRLANDEGGDKKDIFDSPHSMDTKATTGAPNTKTMRTMRTSMRQGD